MAGQTISQRASNAGTRDVKRAWTSQDETCSECDSYRLRVLVGEAVRVALAAVDGDRDRAGKRSPPRDPPRGLAPRAVFCVCQKIASARRLPRAPSPRWKTNWERDRRGRPVSGVGVALVDQPSQHLPAADRQKRRRRSRRRFASWSGERKRAVWPLGVVMGEVAAQDALELAPAQDQQPVETFGPRRAHESLRDRVRSLTEQRGGTSVRAR